MSVLETEEISTVEGLHEIEEEWGSLLEESPWSTPFQSAEWLIPWWKNFGKGRLLTVAIRSGGALRGFAPFILKKGGIRLLGDGISDYLGLLFCPSMEVSAAEALLEHLARRDGWSTCEFQELRPFSALLFLKPPNGLKAVLAPGQVCLRVELPSSVEAFKKKHGWYGRNGSKKVWRRMDARGLEIKSASDEAEVASWLEILFRLHTKRWEAEGKSGVLRGVEIRAFHKEAALGFFRKGALRLYKLSFQDRDMAVLYGFVHKGLYYAYLMGFDPDFSSVSPGRLLLYKAAEDCISQGMTGIDFLRGAEKYKYDWAPVVTRNYTLQITKPRKRT